MCLPGGRAGFRVFLFNSRYTPFLRPLRFREKELRDEEGNKKTGSDAGSGDLSAAPVKAGDKQAEV